MRVSHLCSSQSRCVVMDALSTALGSMATGWLVGGNRAIVGYSGLEVVFKL